MSKRASRSVQVFSPANEGVSGDDYVAAHPSSAKPIMDESNDIKTFLDGSPFAVVGASRDRDKYGNKVLRCYLQNNRQAYPVHPKESEIEGVTCYANLAAVPEELHGVSIITPPAVSQHVVREAIELGIRHLWFQPGSEHEEAIEEARAAGLSVIAHGPCLLVALGYQE
ncbi:MAG: putative CoA-binding protein [Planctomycetota bacterium]|jgi:predicted CoA-binding protein